MHTDTISNNNGHFWLCRYSVDISALIFDICALRTHYNYHMKASTTTNGSRPNYLLLLHNVRLIGNLITEFMRVFETMGKNFTIQTRLQSIFLRYLYELAGVPVGGKLSVCLIWNCMKYRIIILIIIIKRLGEILLSYMANTSHTHARTHSPSVDVFSITALHDTTGRRRCQ